MSKQVLFIGDCQAGALASAYQEFVAPLNNERVSWISLKQEAAKAVQGLKDWDAVVIQVFDVDRLISPAELPAGIKMVEFPAIFLGSLWPYCQKHGHVRNRPEPARSPNLFPPQFGDTFLDRLILQGTPADEALKRYLDLDIARAAHLDRLLELHLETQAARDERTGFAFARAIESQFRDESLFITSSHPTMPLWLPLLRGVFERMQVAGPVIERAIRSQLVPPFPEASLPIHPGVIRHFGLKFVTETTRYPFWNGGSLSFSEFVSCYMGFTPDYGAPEPFVRSLYRNLRSKLRLSA